MNDSHNGSNSSTPCYAYIRCSGLSQLGEDKDGFRRQADAVDKFAAGAGYELKAIWPERGVSGLKDETQRPTFNAMLAEVVSNGVKHVLVENLSRLARQYRIQEQLMLYLTAKDVQLISCDTGENITQAILGDPMRKALVQIQSVFFELERSLLVKKLATARQQKRMNGQRCEGAKPYGTRPGESEKLAMLRDFKSQGKTLAQIASLMNSGGFKSRRGLWHPTSVRRVLSR